MQSSTKGKPRTISVEEIAPRLGVSEPTVYQMLRGGHIPALRVGKLWLVSRVQYEQWEATFGASKEAVRVTGLAALPDGC